jgi:tetratricopeptide (TPR) repeat protein
MTVHLWPFWYRRGWHGEARVWLESALAGGTSDDLTLRAEALRILGAVLNVLGETTAAREPAAEALQIYRRLGNHAFASACLRTLGWTSLLRRDLDEARQLYAEALGEARAAGETVDISASILGLAAIADDADEPEQAVAYATEGLELARRTEAVSLVAEGLLQRSSGLLAAGQAREALPALEEGLDVARSLGHRRYQVHFLSYLSVAHLLLGDSDRSAAYGRECLSHASELADSYLIAYGLEGIALAATAGKDFRRAAVLWGAASRIRGAATITPFTRRLYDRYQRDVLAQLGRRQFEESWKVGEAMQRDDAVSCALEESSEDAP